MQISLPLPYLELDEDRGFVSRTGRKTDASMGLLEQTTLGGGDPFWSPLNWNWSLKSWKAQADCLQWLGLEGSKGMAHN